MNDKDELGDRMKMLEMAEAGRFLIPLLPVAIRLDGKCFSKFTSDLERPFDKRLTDLMVEVTKILVDESNSIVGYTQSDEISLIMYSETYKSQIYYNGRIQKLIGDLAALASVAFNNLLPKYLPEKKIEKISRLPRFDCRVWNVPNKEEAVNNLIWRQNDCLKNSVSMSAQHYYSHNQLLNKNQSEMMDMLMEKGVNWNDYPNFFKRGTFVKRKIVKRKFTTEEIELLPPKHEARKNTNLEVERSDILVLDIPPLTKITNRVNFIFGNEEPQIIKED